MHTYIEQTRPGPRADRRPEIEGWGVDLATADRPAYPKERTPPRLDVPWTVPDSQTPTVEILHSNERPGLTPVFGATVPPRGLSGMLRRLAFRTSENDLRHWLVLLLADRINVVEGLASDVLHGHVPNIFREMGGRAELRYNPQGLARKAAVGVAVVVVSVGLIALLRRKRGSQ